MSAKKHLHQLKIGVLGGGQLGRMLALDAQRLGVDLFFLDKDASYPAGQVCDCDHFTIGDFNNYDDVLAFGKDKDIVTIEIENVNTDALHTLEQQGVTVYPQPQVLKIIKDKGLQKQLYAKENISTADFFLADDKVAILQGIKEHDWQYPFVQKSRLAGYDGKGVQVIKSADELDKVWDVPSVIEVGIAIAKEIAVLVARGESGEVITYDPVEMVFDTKANVLDYQLAPANISSEQDEQLVDMAKHIATQFDIVGLLVVEFFITTDNTILVNEVAPRTHNSGHHTLDAAVCSQFEQQIRTITGLPFGSITLQSPSFMINLLGESDANGPVYYQGMDEVLAFDEVKIHIYGKAVVKPRRKMGHINVLSDDVSLVHQIKNIVKVIAR